MVTRCQHCGISVAIVIFARVLALGMAQPLLQRPLTSDVSFDNKSGRTAEGWPVEQIKAGSLYGLTAYACCYATRRRRPHLLNRDQSRIGLDADYCTVFWNELPAAVGIPAIFNELHAYLRSVSSSVAPRTSVPLTIVDGLLVALEPARRHVLWLTPVGQVQLLAHGRVLADALTLAIRGQEGGSTPEEESALDLLETALRAAERAVDAAAAAATSCVPATNRILQRLFGRVTTADGTPIPIFSYATDLEGADASIDYLWDASPASIARQWTHMEMVLFHSIPVSEVLVAGWDKPRYEHVADATRALIDHFNAGALWVAAEALAPDAPAERAAVIARWIQIACALRRLNCFSGLFQIAMGLKREAVTRLDATWSYVPALARERWAAILALTGACVHACCSGWGGG